MHGIRAYDSADTVNGDLTNGVIAEVFSVGAQACPERLPSL
jgi:hypothetical protein